MAAFDWSDFYNNPEPKPKGDTTGPTSFFDNPYLNDDSINLDYTKAVSYTHLTLPTKA